MVRFTAYVHDDTAAKIRAHARAQDRSIAGELRRALRLYVEMLDRTLKDQAAGADRTLTDRPTWTDLERPGGIPTSVKE
jgi:hypothetical protein